jgi:hypothetical protein
MTALELEAVPNALAMPKPKRLDPWAEPEPLVLLLATDTPKERRMAEKLEEATRRALESWLRGGGR